MAGGRPGGTGGGARTDREKRLAEALRRNLRLRKEARHAATRASPAMDERASPATIADRLRQTARAHHEAFAEVDGADPEWAAWYARNLAPDLPGLLGRRLDEAEISALLVAAEAARTEAGQADWPSFYARFLLGRG
jgi:hypothetical protein